MSVYEITICIVADEDADVFGFKDEVEALCHNVGPSDGIELDTINIVEVV